MAAGRTVAAGRTMAATRTVAATLMVAYLAAEGLPMVAAIVGIRAQATRSQAIRIC